MTITELRSTLEGLESQGHGGLPLYHLEEDKRPIEGVEIITDVPNPVAMLY
jgi:hypothetical protein